MSTMQIINETGHKQRPILSQFYPIESYLVVYEFEEDKVGDG